jgi:hypothetical protein
MPGLYARFLGTSIKDIIFEKEPIMEEQIIDVTEEIKKEVVSRDAFLAKQKGKNVLILKHTEPTRRFDGKRGTYRLEHRWLSNPDDVHSCQGRDFSIWMKKEILSVLNGKISLFDFFDINGG